MGEERAAGGRQAGRRRGRAGTGRRGRRGLESGRESGVRAGVVRVFFPLIYICWGDRMLSKVKIC